VERNNGTHQDRLVKKPRRKGIASHAAANAYIEGEYLAEHNRRFAQPAAEPEDYHRKAPSRRELDAIFRLETERTISNDWVVRPVGASALARNDPGLLAKSDPPLAPNPGN
jgi:hypothetical protein